MRNSVNGTVVVTGIGGFVGTHIARQLLAAGYSVRGTMRKIDRAATAAKAIRQGVEGHSDALTFAAADLLSDTGWEEALAGADHLIHAASPFPASVPKTDAELVEPARSGTLRVLKAAHRAGIRRVVLTSSIAAINYGSARAPFTEADWTDPDGPLATPYYRSKTLAERAAWAFAGESGLELAVVNPGMILGPLIGRNVGTSVGVIRNMLKGRYPVLPDFSVAIVDVRDVASAHILCLTSPKAAGERFIAAGEALSLAEIGAILKASFPAQAGRVPRFVLPNWLAPLAGLFDPGLRLIVKELGRDARVSHDKASHILGWTPRPAADAVRASAQSLIDAGLV